jgi:hypothetical protein
VCFCSFGWKEKSKSSRDPLKSLLGAQNTVKSEKCLFSRTWSPGLPFGGLIRTAIWDSMKKVFQVCFSCRYRLICTQSCNSVSKRKLHSALLPHTKNHFLHQPSAPAQRPTTFGSIGLTEKITLHTLQKSLFHHHNDRIVNSIKNIPQHSTHQNHFWLHRMN